jgi:hypothetical protein
LEEINQVKPGDEQWERMIWGDFVERDGEFLGEWGGRPQWGGKYFKRMMERYQLTLLIRSHQPNHHLDNQQELYHDLYLMPSADDCHSGSREGT